jgi:hypothetical protein
MSNAMMQLHLYKRGDTWKFDDPMHGIKAEPFVLGMSEMIDYYVDDDTIKKATLTFSHNKFPNCNELNLLHEESNGGWYVDPESDMTGWLCPVTRTYMDKIPKKIYFLLEPKERKNVLKSILYKIKGMGK